MPSIGKELPLRKGQKGFVLTVDQHYKLVSIFSLRNSCMYVNYPTLKVGLVRLILGTTAR